MPDLTTRFQLKKPRGGSSGSTPAEQVDIDVINGNMNIIDGQLGLPVVTSTSLPSSPVAGQGVFVSDYNSVAVYNGVSWVVAGSRMRNQIALDDASTGTTIVGGAAQDSTSWPFTIPNTVSTATLRAQGSFYAYLGSAVNFAGNAYLFVDAVQQATPIRFHNHGRAGMVTFSQSWNISLGSGSHTAFVRLGSDSGSATFEVWDRHMQFSLEY